MPLFKLPGSLVANGYMGDGIVAGAEPGASLSHWSRLTETPQVVPQVGCNGPGCLQMWGNKVVGDSDYQQLGGPANEAGKIHHQPKRGANDRAENRTDG